MHGNPGNLPPVDAVQFYQAVLVIAAVCIALAVWACSHHNR